MNLAIKSVVFWVIFLMLMTTISATFLTTKEPASAALKQFDKPEQAQAEINAIAAERNKIDIVKASLWCLAIALYVNMVMYTVRKNDKQGVV